jgi:hypothetical protein
MITVAQLLKEHVSLDIECVDRIYLNGYIPSLQTPQGLTSFMRYHFYIDDADFGPAFIKICTYAPFSVRVCLNGHEWVKPKKSFWLLVSGF